jgi:hypothetical protein
VNYSTGSAKINETAKQKMSSVLAELSLWAVQDHFVVAVLVPLLIWTSILVVESYRGSYSRELLKWWLIGAVITFLTGRWKVSDEGVALHLVCAFSLICFFLVYCKKAVPPLLAGSLVFYNLLMNDIAHATVWAWQGRLDATSFLVGVGGAGPQDGLVVFPLLTALVLFYANWRLGKTEKLAFWY